MKLFQRFFSPKWKNKNPDVRKQALIALSRDDNQDVFTEIANQDDVSDLRQLAVKRINSFDALISISANNSDAKVQALANKIISQILAGSNEHKIPLSQQERVSKINSLDTLLSAQTAENQNILELIAEKGDATVIRVAAIAHVKREALLGNILIKESDTLIKHNIAEKISQKSTLERVLKAIKNKDKQTSKIIKAKLDHIIAQEEKPRIILAQQKTLCQNMEQLGKKGLWERDKLQFDHIKTQWNDLCASLKTPEQNLTLDSKLENRYNIAVQLFQDNYNNYLSRNEARLKKEADLLPLKEEKQALINQFHQLLLSATEQKFQHDLSELTTQFASAQQQWQTIKSLPDEIEQDFNKQYQDVCNSLKTHIRNIESTNKANGALNSLLADAKYAVKNSHKLNQTKINHLEKSLTRISTTALAPALQKASPLITEIKTLIEKAKQTVEKNKIKASEIFSHTQSFINVLETALNEGEIKTANDTQKTIQANIKKLEKLGHNNLTEIKQQDLALSSKLVELNQWRSWANTPQKERLISEMEALINNDMDPKEVAFLVSKARKEWQLLGPSDHKNSQAMWEKFSIACDIAYEPCKSVFEDEAKMRTENYEKRIVFLNDLESFVKNADWENVSWVKVENLFQQARREWHNLGTVDKNKRKAINSRFNQANLILKEKLTVEWDKNAITKQNIVNESQALIESEDLNTAINTAKDLQKQWKNAGRIQRHLENKLWGSFRENCDKIFARRESINKQKKNDDEAEKLKIEALCTELESLCNKPEKEINQLSDEIFSLRKQISTLTNETDKSNKSINTRISQALTIFETKKETAARIDQISSLISLKEKINFLQKIEISLPLDASKSWDVVSQELNAINSPSNINWEKMINDRFSTLSNIEDPKSIYQNADKNLANIKNSTILLEIIAEINTPKEDSAERLKIQTERLNKKLNNHNEEDQWNAFINTEANWLLNGPVTEPELKPFRERHDTIIKELKQQYAIELEDY